MTISHMIYSYNGRLFKVNTTDFGGLRVLLNLISKDQHIIPEVFLKSSTSRRKREGEQVGQQLKKVKKPVFDYESYKQYVGNPTVIKATKWTIEPKWPYYSITQSLGRIFWIGHR